MVINGTNLELWSVFHIEALWKKDILARYPQADVSRNEVSTLAQIYIPLHCWQRYCHALNLPFFVYSIHQNSQYYCHLLMKQGIRIVICSLILVVLFAPAFDAHGSLLQKRVLLLYSEDKAHPAHELTDGGIRAVFRSNKLFDVRLYSEYLDLSRFSGPGHARAIADCLNRKYAGTKIDAIITIYPAALDMFLGEASAGFPGAQTRANCPLSQ
jgi:hypothetical protein